MMYKKQLEELSELSRQFDAGLLQSQEADILSLSFFSRSYDILKQMMTLLQSVEELQIGKMQEQLDAHKTYLASQVSKTPHLVGEEKGEETPPPPEENNEKQVAPVACPVVDPEMKEEIRQWKIALSDRFLFVKELFAGDKAMMDEALKEMETFSTLTEAVSYLDDRFGWDWKEETPSLFKVSLESFYG